MLNSIDTPPRKEQEAASSWEDPMLTEVFVATGVCILLSALMLALSTNWTVSLGPNVAFGLKTRATKSSQEAWEAGHRAARPVLVTSAVSGLVATLFCVGFHSANAETSLIAVVVTALFLTASLVASTFIANRRAKGVMICASQRE
ncbi:SdpI family protein [Auritidibacter ignavus]|uniref:SdpI family protein n=1 Tax=Auritidibacter ignavus TaxID=678932 RepID=UPI0024BAB3EF|nr:SdpI family protein [Auritidibacter ignavus]WHS28751.1 SdpI family protein [Auritidibacter ignavus]